MRPLAPLRHVLVFTCGALVALRLPAENTLVLNPEFDAGSGISHWFVADAVQVSSWSLDDADECTGSGSYQAIAIPQSGSPSLTLGVPSDCLDVQADAQLFQEVTYRSGRPLYLYLLLYPSADCQGAQFTQKDIPVHPASDDWATVASVTTLPVGEPVASVRFVASSLDDLGNGFTTFFDRPYLGSAERVFGDDFDTGSTCRWSTALP